MAQVNLNCPHCGGSFSLDHEQPLQTYWICPYCGSRSLMQKTHDTIRLRGIIGSPGVPQNLAGTETKPDTESVQTIRQPESVRPPARAAWPTVKDIWPPPATPPEDDRPEPISRSSGEQSPPSAARTSEEHKPSEHKPSAGQRTLSDYIAEVAEKDRPAENQEKEAHVHGPTSRVSLDHYIELAEEAAKNHHLPVFNSYSRQAIDQKPDDRRMYALRARLIEEANGFANRTWASPVWYLYTPRQKAALLAQHLYAFNTALRYSNGQEQDDLAGQVGRQLVRQAVEHLTERAEIRCGRRWIGRTFKGRYHHADLQEASDFCDAIKRIDDSVCPLGSSLLQQSIRVEASALPNRLARCLTHF